MNELRSIVEGSGEAGVPNTASDLKRGPERRRTFTLRFTLLALILTLLVTSGLAINGIWLVKSRSVARDLSDQYFNLLSRMVAQRASDMLSPAALLLRQHQIEAQRRLINVGDFSDLGMRLVERLRARPNLAQLYHATAATGEFVGAWQAEGNTIVLSRSVPDVDEGAFSEWTIYPDGSRAQDRRDLKTGYDARQRVWFKLAAAQPDDHLVWTEPYTFFRTQRPGITAAQAWRLPGDASPRGVFAADFSLDGIGNFLTENSRLDGARSFLVTRQGQIVVSSKQDPGDPDDAVWPAVQAALPHPLTALQMNSPVNVSTNYNGATYLGVVQMFRIAGGPEWALVSVVPEARFLAASIASIQVAGAIGLAVVLAAIVLGWLVSGRVARPLLQITEELGRVGRFELSPNPTPSSLIREVMVVSEGVDRMKTSLRSFSRYVPVDLVRDVMASGREAELSADVRELTLFVSDIAGFTAISEGLAPDELVTQLAEYLEAMTGAIRAEGGTIDKYVGDGIIALFNAPRLVPQHAAAACRAALAARTAALALQNEWHTRGLPGFPTRIGLNKGEVVVGNIGTRERFAYTAMGDAMNLASRLESLNKTYGTTLMASEAVWKEAGSEFEWRKLDRVAVVGRNESTLVFELLGEAGRLTPAEKEARDQYEAALGAYFAGQFSEAARGFRLAGRLRPGDRAAEVMTSRILDFAKDPPGSEWDGVFASHEK